MSTTEYEALKSRAQFFKAGSIVPRRAIKCTQRKWQHLLKFANDTYMIPGPHGYVAFSETVGAKYFSKINTPMALVFNGSPYHRRDPSFRGFVWHEHSLNSEEFEARVLESMQPSKIRWIDTKESV